MKHVLTVHGLSGLHRNMIHRLVVVACLWAIAGCSVSQDQEVQLGRENAAQINAQLPIVSDPAITDYIEAVGQSIASRTSRRDLDWRFYVVNTDQINAFALPGGFVYVNRGLIESARQLDDLTGSLGHEIGHVVQRHSVKQMQKAQKTNVGIGVLCTLTSICESGLAQVAVQVGGSAYFARNSRLAELQADSEAVVNVARAGYDPRGLPDLFRILMSERQSQPGKVEGWFMDHPLEEDRIQRVSRLIARMPETRGRKFLMDTPAFQRFKSRVAALPAPPRQATREQQ